MSWTAQLSSSLATCKQKVFAVKRVSSLQFKLEKQMAELNRDVHQSKHLYEVRSSVPEDSQSWSSFGCGFCPEKDPQTSSTSRRSRKFRVRSACEELCRDFSMLAGTKLGRQKLLGNWVLTIPIPCLCTPVSCEVLHIPRPKMCLLTKFVLKHIELGI